ncbi:dihydrolipoamide acetyltransferase [Pyxidicoccus sp. 3LG]
MRVAAATFHLLALLSATVCVPALAQESSPAPAAATAPAAEQSQAPVAPTAPAASVEAPAGGSPQTADEAFNTRVKTLEEQVVDLKEKIYRSKARLLLLQESVLGGNVSTGARAVIIHKNEMGGSFYLESVSYSLDGAPIATLVDNGGDLGKREEFEVFNGRIIPGQHLLAVRLVYRGHGYGVFSYLEGYKFKVQASENFNAEPGKVTTLHVVGFEEGGFTTDMKDRAKVRYTIEVSNEAARPSEPGSATPAPATSSSETK